MANHKSSIKRIRANEKKRLANRYNARTTRNALKKIRLTTDQNDAKTQLPVVISLIDKLAKRGVIHKNKAANLKSGLMKKVAKL
jgi:small subunit ribosomal protein S20